LYTQHKYAPHKKTRLQRRRAILPTGLSA